MMDFRKKLQEYSDTLGDISEMYTPSTVNNTSIWITGYLLKSFSDIPSKGKKHLEERCQSVMSEFSHLPSHEIADKVVERMKPIIERYILSQVYNMENVDKAIAHLEEMKEKTL